MKDSLLLISLDKLKTKGMLFIKLSCAAAYYISWSYSSDS